MQAWSDSNNIAEGGKSTVVIALENSQTGQGRVLPIPPVLDYIWRPIEYEHVCAYDWIRLNHKRSIPKSRRKFTKPHAGNQQDDDSDFENNYHIDEQIPITDPYSADSDVDEVELAEDSDCEQDDISPTLYGGAHPQQHLDDDSEDELLLTAESNQKLQQESIKSHTKRGRSHHTVYFMPNTLRHILMKCVS